MSDQVVNDFAKIGARVKLRKLPQRNVRVFNPRTLLWPRAPDLKYTVDVGEDSKGEFFDIAVADMSDVGFRVINTDPEIRHLVLMDTGDKKKMLCGHDERHWFAAEVGERSGIKNVADAMAALKPLAVARVENELHVKPEDRQKRKNPAYIRQGEWFFVPVGDKDLSAHVIHKNEPIQLVGRSEHIVEELCRHGGETVMTCARYRGGKPISLDKYNKLIRTNKEANTWFWQTRTQGATVYARGAVRHGDHATIHLQGWHEVHATAEMVGSTRVTFLD